MTRLPWNTPVLVIADDFTGANDAGAGLASVGARVHVLFDTAPSGLQADVWVVNTDSRALSAELAASRTAAAVAALVEVTGDGWLFKKIDSTLRGNPGAEIEAALLASGKTAALIAPAVPALGRTTAEGYCFINGRLLTETEYASDPKTPVNNASVLARLQEQSSLPVGLIPLSAQANLREQIAAAIASGQRLIVLDAQTDRDLQRIMQAAEALPERPLLAGAAGLSEALGRMLANPDAAAAECSTATVNASGQEACAEWPAATQGALASAAVKEAAERPEPGIPASAAAAKFSAVTQNASALAIARRASVARSAAKQDVLSPDAVFAKSAAAAKGVLAAIGSMSEAAQRQIARLQQQHAIRLIDIDITAIFNGRLQDITWRQEATEALQHGQHCIIRTCQQAEQRQAIASLCGRYGLSRQQLGERICAYLAELTADVLRDATPSALYLSGGDVAIAVARELGAQGFQIDGQIAGCVPYGYLLAGKNDLLVLTKAGGFGDDNTLVEVFRFIEEKASE